MTQQTNNTQGSNPGHETGVAGHSHAHSILATSLTNPSGWTLSSIKKLVEASGALRAKGVGYSLGKGAKDTQPASKSFLWLFTDGSMLEVENTEQLPQIRIATR